MNSPAKIIDAEKGRWLTNKSWVAVMAVFLIFAVQAAGYMRDIEAGKKLDEEAPKKEKYYAQVISEQRVINNTLMLNYKKLDENMTAIREELVRLKLVSSEIENTQYEKNQLMIQYANHELK